MKQLSGALASLLASGITTLCRLVDVTLNNGSVFYFTDSDRDVTYQGNVYSSRYGCRPSQTRMTLGTSAENFTVEVLLAPGGLTSALLETGALDSASIRVLVCDWSNPASAAVYFVGRVSSVDFEDRQTATLNAQTLLAQDTTLAEDVFCSNCRADLGDAKCKVDVTSLKAAATVTAVGTLQVLHLSDTSAASRWQAGLVLFTTGENAGGAFEIADSAADGTVTLRGLTPFPVAVGDNVTLYQGCDKTLTMCGDRYNNVLNFRGEPFSVAPWIATSEQPYTSSNASGDTGVGTANLRALFYYEALHIVTRKNDQANQEIHDELWNPALVEWGPINDSFGFYNPKWGPYGVGGDHQGYPGEIGNGATTGGSGQDSRKPFNTKVAANIQYISFEAGTTFAIYYEYKRPLTPDEAAKVRQAFPAA